MEMTEPGSDARNNARASIEARQHRYTLFVESLAQADRAPKTVEGMGAAILSSLSQIQGTIDGVLDVIRYVVSSLYLSPCTRWLTYIE